MVAMCNGPPDPGCYANCGPNLLVAMHTVAPSSWLPCTPLRPPYHCSTLSLSWTLSTQVGTALMSPVSPSPHPPLLRSPQQLKAHYHPTTPPPDADSMARHMRGENPYTEHAPSGTFRHLSHVTAWRDLYYWTGNYKK